MAGYTKEFLIDAACYRFLPLGLDKYESVYQLTVKSWNENSKEDFRAYNSLDAQAIKDYKAWLTDNEH